jgi:hypothetical protein
MAGAVARHHRMRARARADGSQRPPTHRASRKRPANQLSAIRAKIRFWRAPMRREVFAHENFFIAKFRDSESAQSAFGCTR